MHLLLTDRLACPRCGPGFGLILLADRVEDRRVFEGSLGCPNCRDRYPVTDGFGDLRAPPRDPIPVPGDDAPDPADGVVRLGALLGVTDGPGHLALVGDVALLAPGLSDLLDGPEVVAVSSRLVGEPERPGVSRIVCRPRLPFYSGSLRGVALSGRASERFLDEAVRVAAATARVAVVDPPPGTGDRLADAGLRVVLDEEKAVVASREPRAGSAAEGVALPVFPGPGPENP